jgi:hypothetical protein
VRIDLGALAPGSPWHEKVCRLNTLTVWRKPAALTELVLTGLTINPKESKRGPSIHFPFHTAGATCSIPVPPTIRSEQRVAPIAEAHIALRRRTWRDTCPKCCTRGARSHGQCPVPGPGD